jgi:zinc protease
MHVKNLKMVLMSLFALVFIFFSISGKGSVVSAQEIKLPPIEKTTLDNGLKVIVIEHHELPVVAFRLVFKSGAAFDPSGKAGQADLTAGLLRKGTKTRTATQIAEEIDFVGGSLGAGSSRDATYANCKVLKKHFDVGLDLLSDIILNPAFADEEIERLRKQTLAAIKQQKDDPGAVADKRYREFLFGDHPYGQPSEGTETSVAALTRDDIVSFHQNYYVPDNAILAVVGDVTPKVAIDKIKAKFSQWKGAQVVPPGHAQPPAVEGHQVLLVDKPDLTQTYIRVGHLGVKRDNPDYFAVRVMNYILGGGGFSSRMMDEIRSKRGLTYGIGCRFDFNKLRGAYTVSTFTQNDSTAVAIRAIIEQIANFRAGGVTDKELADTKSFYTGYFPLQLETPSQIASQILNVELHGLGEGYLKNYRKNMNAVTKEDIQRVAKKYLDPNNLKLVVVSKAEDVKASLEPLGSVTVTSFLE